MATWFITFRTYGTWLHGDERGSVDDRNNPYGEPLIPANAAWNRYEASLLKHPPMELSDSMRHAVDVAIRSVCEHRGWTLHELNVRTNHVHVVVSVDALPERAMNDFKVWSTRRLRENGHVPGDAVVWARHGSTRLLTSEHSFSEACVYVRDGQDNRPPPSRSGFHAG